MEGEGRLVHHAKQRSNFIHDRKLPYDPVGMVKDGMDQILM